MGEPFRTTRLVEFHDTDMAGIMHFASFFHYMESAEHEFIRSLGYSVHSRINGKLLSFPRVSVSCDYQSPAQSEDILDIAILVTRIGTKSITYSFEVSHDNLEVAKGQITCVCCSVEPGQPIHSEPIPQELIDKLQPYMA